MIVKEKLDKVLGWGERHFPWLMGLVSFAIVVVLFHDTPLEITHALSSILDAVITFSSVSVGFIGVLLGVLFSVRDAPLIAGLLGNDGTQQLTHRYFREAILGGLALVVLSSLLHLLSLPGEYKTVWPVEVHLSTVCLALWAGLAVYSLLASYRVMSLMMKALFNSEKRARTRSSRKSGPKMDPEDVIKLERELGGD